MNAKCVVIGGAGFIGTQLTKLLAASGREVVVMGRSPRPGHIRYEQGDYGDRAALRRVLAGAGEVIDLAYATAPQTSFADPIFDVVSNLPPSVSLLQEAVASGVRKVLVVSSGGTVYGVPRSLPIREDHPTNPISPYGITKLAIENYAWMFRTLFDLPVVVVRPSNAYGEGQRRLSGQGFIAAAMRCAKEGAEVEVYGQHGTVRDYIHVSDVATGILAALDKGVPGAAYNIGTGRGTSNVDVLRILESLAARAGLRLRTKLLPVRKFDVPANCLDSERLRAVSGWRAVVSLEDGMARMWQAILAGDKS
jgi:UDP-glucose 4-epimerase